MTKKYNSKKNNSRKMPSRNYLVKIVVRFLTERAVLWFLGENSYTTYKKGYRAHCKKDQYVSILI